MSAEVLGVAIHPVSNDLYWSTRSSLATRRGGRSHRETDKNRHWSGQLPPIFALFSRVTVA
jgi:hypothetical protein